MAHPASIAMMMIVAALIAAPLLIWIWSGPALGFDAHVPTRIAAQHMSASSIVPQRSGMPGRHSG